MVISRSHAVATVSSRSHASPHKDVQVQLEAGCRLLPPHKDVQVQLEAGCRLLPPHKDVQVQLEAGCRLLPRGNAEFSRSHALRGNAYRDVLRHQRLKRQTPHSYALRSNEE